jgi:hypothetical protein
MEFAMSKKISFVKLAFCAPEDVSDELKIARDIVDEWNVNHGEHRELFVKLVNWKSDSRPGAGRPQEVINHDVIDDADILIGIFWTRFGSPTGMAESGTEEEIRLAIKNKRKVLVYFSNRPTSFAVIASQIGKIERFKKEYKDQGLYWQYGSIETFTTDLRRHLAKYLNEWPQQPVPKKRSKKTSKVASQPRKGNFAQYMANSPGAIQAERVTIKTTRKNKPPILPINAIGANGEMRAYIQYLAKKYVDWRIKGIESGKDKRHFHPSMIHQWIKRDFGDSTYYVSQNRFADLVDYLKELIDGTIFGGMRKRSGERNYHSFEDHLKILRGS